MSETPGDYYRQKAEQLRGLASHNLDEREKLIAGIEDALKFLKHTRHSWNGPIHRAVAILEGVIKPAARVKEK